MTQPEKKPIIFYMLKHEVDAVVNDGDSGGYCEVFICLHPHKDDALKMAKFIEHSAYLRLLKMKEELYKALEKIQNECHNKGLHEVFTVDGEYIHEIARQALTAARKSMEELK